MSERFPKEQLLYQVAQRCSHKNTQTVVSDSANVMFNYKGQFTPFAYPIQEAGSVKQLLELKGELQIQNRGSNYTILTSLSFPFIYPEAPVVIRIYNVDTSRFAGASPDQSVVNIHLPELASWNSHRNIGRLMIQLVQDLTQNFPFYDKTVAMNNVTAYNQPYGGSQPYGNQPYTNQYQVNYAASPYGPPQQNQYTIPTQNQNQNAYVQNNNQFDQLGRQLQQYTTPYQNQNQQQTMNQPYGQQSYGQQSYGGSQNYNLSVPNIGQQQTFNSKPNTIDPSESQLRNKCLNLFNPIMENINKNLKKSKEHTDKTIKTINEQLKQKSVINELQNTLESRFNQIKLINEELQKTIKENDSQALTAENVLESVKEEDQISGWLIEIQSDLQTYKEIYHFISEKFRKTQVPQEQLVKLTKYYSEQQFYCILLQKKVLGQLKKQ